MIEQGELILIVEAADRLLAVRAVDVASVNEIDNVVPVPGGPDYIEGMGAQRSRALTVIDMRRAIGIAPQDAGKANDRSTGQQSDGRCLIVSRGDYHYALRPDRVLDVSPAFENSKPVPKGLGEAWARVSRGVVETATGSALLLDIDAILQGPERASTKIKAA